jgi:hypothetical protein
MPQENAVSQYSGYTKLWTRWLESNCSQLWTWRAVIGRWICILIRRLRSRRVKGHGSSIMPCGLATPHRRLSGYRSRLKWPHLPVMSPVPGWRDRYWPQVPRAPTQNAESLQRFREARLKLNTEMCQHFRKEIRYLGHVVSPEGITTDLEKLRAVREWPTSKNKQKIRSFLGLYAYYRRFIFSFTDITKPLTKFTEEK